MRGAYFSCWQRPARKSSREAPGTHGTERVSWEAALEEELAGLQCAFLQPAIPWEDLKDLSGIGFLIRHGLPCESVTVSWQGKAGTPHWKLHVSQQLRHLSQMPLINVHPTAAEVYFALFFLHTKKKNLNKPLGQSETPDNALHNDNTRCAAACSLRSPAQTTASPAGQGHRGCGSPMIPCAQQKFPWAPTHLPLRHLKTDWKIPMRLLEGESAETPRAQAGRSAASARRGPRLRNRAPLHRVSHPPPFPAPLPVSPLDGTAPTPRGRSPSRSPAQSHA